MVFAVTNTAPTLDSSATPTFTTIAEDPGSPSGAVGTLVSALIGLVGGGGLDNTSDIDPGPATGIAITTASASGSWFYSINGGANWLALGAVSGTSSRLLYADASTRLYFQPSLDFSGTLASAITFRAYDRSTGTNGGLADTSVNGGTTAFSTATDTASITVTPVNDGPTVNGGADDVAVEGVATTALSSQIVIADVDAGTQQVSVTLSTLHGSIDMRTDVTGGVDALHVSGDTSHSVTLTGTVSQINATLANSTGLTYLADIDFAGTDVLTVLVNDGGNSGAGGTLTATDTVSIAVSAAPASNTLTAQQSSALAIAAGSDVDGDGVIDPGDTVTLTVRITNNSAATTASSITFNEVPSGLTTVTTNVSPLAFSDSYSAVGNTALYVGVAAGSAPVKTVAGNVFSNDTEFLGDSFVLSSYTATSAQGGTVAMNANGTFTYMPATGFTGTDTFTYTIKDDGLDNVAGNADDLTGTATVTITVANRVWYVDSSAGAGGNGTSTSPFNSFASLNGAAGAGDVDGSGDYLYVKGNTTANLVLEASEHLIGAGTSLVVGGVTLAAAGSAAHVTAASGTVVTLSSGNQIAGMAIDGTGSAIGLQGAGFGTLTVDNTAISTTGQALSLSVGDVAGTGFTSVSSTGGSSNVSLSVLTGTVALGTGALTGSTTSAFDVSGGSETITYSGSITANASRAVVINNHDSGTITFATGAITSSGASALGIQVLNSNGGTVNFNGQTTLSTATNTAVDLQNNTGLTVNFNAAGSGLDITTTTGTGFRALGGGTVNVAAGGGNSISSTGAPALNVANTAIGSGNLNFQSISATGGANGIILNNTGTGGGLTVTGTGTANSGGTIQNMTADGISILSSANLNLTNVKIINTSGDGIDASNLFGTNTITSSIIQNWDTGATALNDGIRFVNTSGSTALTITGTTFDGVTGTPATGGPGNGFFMEAQSGANMAMLVNGSTFTHMFADGVQVSSLANSTGAVQVQVRDSQFNGAVAEVSGAGGGNGGIVLNVNGANLKADIIGNTLSGVMTAYSNAGAITGAVGSTASADITVQGNTITNLLGGRGMTFSMDGTSSTRLLIDNNSIDNLGSNHAGISINETINAAGQVTVTNNRIGQSGTVAGQLWTTGPMLSNALLLQTQNASTMTALVASNTISANTDDVIPVTRVRAIDTSVLQATFSSNTLRDTSVVVANTVFDATAGNSVGGTVYLNIVSNALPGGGAIQLTDGALGVLYVTQASAPAVAAANANSTVSPSGSPVYGVPIPGNPTPVLPTHPTSPVPPVVNGLLADFTGSVAPVEGSPPSGVTLGSPPTLASAAGAVTMQLTQADLDVIVGAAIARWKATGLTAEQEAILDHVTVSVTDMQGLYLGSASAGQVSIDTNAAGFGWFVDATPADDAEFSNTVAATQLQASAGQVPAAHVDLLTTVMHELGHQLGLGDMTAPASRADLMYASLVTGERRLPAAGEAAAATGPVSTSPEFLAGGLNIGTLEAGQTVTIQINATVNAQTNQLIVNPTNSAPVISTFPTVFTNTNVTTLDTLVLGDRVFNDVNRNGVFDAGDTGIDNVALQLLVDAGTAGFDAGDTTVVATATTSGGGYYSFLGLAPGNYLVQATEANFNAGGALNQLASAGVSANVANDNIDNDNDGARSTGNGIVSSTITLAYNSEPGGDTNNTVDIGLRNEPPVIGNLAGDSATYFEGAPAVFLDIGAAANVTDANDTDFNGGSLTVAITGNKVSSEDVLGAGGTVTFSAGMTSGSTVSVGGVGVGTISAGGTGSGTDNFVVNFNTSATPARVSLLLDALTYSNSNNAAPATATRTVTVTMNDGMGGTHAVTTTVAVTAVNDAPTSTQLQGDVATFVEGGTAVKLDTGTAATLADVDSADFNTGSLSVSVTGNAATKEDVLSIDGATGGAVTLSGSTVLVGGTSVGSFAGGEAGEALVVTLNAGATPARLQEVLRVLQYSDSRTGGLSTAPRTITIALNDGDGTANAGASTLTVTTQVNVTAINHAPAGTDGAQTIDEDATYTFATADFGFTDPNDASANSLQSVVLTTVPGAGTIYLDTDGIGIGAPVAQTAGAEIAASEFTAGHVTFRPVADANGTPYTSFTFQVRDNGGITGGGVDLDPSANTFTLNVTAVNDAPTVDLDVTTSGTGFSNIYVEGAGSATGSPSGLSNIAAVADVDSANLTGATITITNVKTGDLLSANLPLPGNIVASSYNSTTGVLTLSGTATAADYEQALGQMGFSNTSQNPDTTTRLITVTVTDGTATSAAATVSMVVVGTNDAPTLDLDADNSSTATGLDFKGAYVPGGSAAAIADTDSAVGDVDNTSLASALVTITNFKPNDLLAVSGVLPGSIVVASAYNSANGTLRLSGAGTLAQYETAIEQLRFSNTGATPDTTTRVITVSVNDGTLASANATTTITLNQPPATPTDSNNTANGVTEGAAANTAVGITASAIDPESGAITYSLSNSAGGLFQISSSTGVVSVSTAGATGINYETATSHSITVVATDPFGATSSQSFTIPVTNAPASVATDSDTAANTVSEGALAGASVGITAAATDANGGAITYSLTGDAGGRFAIGSTSGIVTVANAALLNFEGASSHQITVHAQDASGSASADQNFTIAVTNVAPGAASDTDTATNTVSEGAVNGALVGVTAASTDVHGGAVTYTLFDSANGRFAIGSTSGIVTVADATQLNFEANTSHTITVRASDGTNTTDQNFTIAVTNVAPVAASDSDTAANAVSEGAVNGALVSVTAASTDVHGGTVTYTLSDSANGRFAIGSSTGIVTVADATQLNFEANTSHTITVRASDGTNTTDQNFTIAVTNVAPVAASDTDTAVNTVSEGAVNGALVGVTASSSDVHGGTVTFTLSNSANGRFAIGSTSGIVTVADASQLNFEANTSHTITVRASDGTNTTDQNFVIAVTNVAPVAASDTDTAANTVSEGAVNGALVGVTAASTDVHGGAVTYTLFDSANGRFAIGSTTGIVTVADATQLNFESNTSHTITVRASDGTNTTDQTFTIAVTNVAPVAASDTNNATNTVSEGAANGALVGVTAGSSDVHGGTVTFTLSDSANGRFAIGSSTGIVTVADATQLNFEANTSHTITVRASDGTNTTDQNFTIAMTNVAPVAASDIDTAVNTVPEGAVNGALVGVTASSSDIHGGTVTFTLSDSANGRFAIGSTSGIVTVADASQLNYESNASHTITVRASDGTATTDQTFTIAVTNVAPVAASDTNIAANTVSEGAVNGALVGITAASTDVHGGTVTYTLSESANGRFAIGSTTGIVTVADATQLNFENNTSHTITVRASDGTATTDQNFTIAVTNVAPVAASDINNAANTVSEGAANGALVGVTASSSDIHGGTVTFSLSDSANGRFTIGSTTGIVTVADATQLNFEANTSHTITVRASDGTATTDQNFTIAVTNVAPAAATDSDAAANAVSEGAVNGALVGVTASAADVHGGTVTYTLSDNANGRFAIGSTTGIVTVANAALLDFETNASHTITVRASDGTNTTDQNFTIAVTNVAPGIATDSNIATNTVSEAAVNGATVGITALATDIHGGTITYSLTASANGRFAIDSSTGVVTVADATQLNYEAATSHQITVRARDSSSAASTDQVFTIAVTDAPPSAPVDANGAINSVFENSANGTLVGLTASSADPHGGTVTYSLTNNAGGAFAIDSATGVVSVANSALLDYENATSKQITVQASDPSGAFTQSSFTIAIADRNDVSPVINIANSVSVAENTTFVAALSVTDPDTVGLLPPTIVIDGGADSARFSIVNGSLVFITAPDFDHPTDVGANNSYEVKLWADDGIHMSVVTLAVNVTDVNDLRPVITTPAALSINENQTVVAALTIEDPDTVGLHPGVFTVVGGADAGRFTVSNGNLVFVAAPDREAPLDSDHNNIYLVTVRANDGVNVYDKQLTVTVNDVNDNTPLLNIASTIAVNENSTAVATLGAIDPDTLGTIAYSISGGADAARFAISGGQLVFVTAPNREAPADAGADNTYNVQLTVSDGTLSSHQDIAVNVQDLNDTAPVVTTGSNFSIVENTRVVTTLTSSDADTVQALPTVYSVSGGADAALFEVVGGQLQFRAAADFDTPRDTGADNNYQVQVSASDGIQSGSKLLSVTVLRDVAELGGTFVGDDLANVLNGTIRRDTFIGNGGNDTITGLAGDDTISGGAGIDIAVFAGHRAGYAVTSSSGALTVSGGDGTDTLTGVERLTFNDISLAFDMSGNGGMAAKLLAAVFGAPLAQNEFYVGIAMGLFDHGTSYEAGATLAMGTPQFQAMVGTPTNTNFVNVVYQNLFGVAPVASERDFLVALLDNGYFTQASMAVAAANTDVNALNIDLVGLASHGLEYLPS